jgi:hypothetical protein
MLASGAERVARTPMILEAKAPNQGRYELRLTSEVGGMEGFVSYACGATPQPPLHKEKHGLANR